MSKAKVDITIANQLLCELVETLETVINTSVSENVIQQAKERWEYLRALKDAKELEYKEFSISKAQTGRNEKAYPQHKK